MSIMNHEEMKHCPSHPGEILQKDFLIHLELSCQEFAEKIKWPAASIQCLIDGNTSMSAMMALKFSKALETTPEFWLNLQNQFDLWHAKKY